MTARLHKRFGAAFALVATAAAGFVMTGCGGGSSDASTSQGPGGPTLVSVEYGRLVVIYSFRRVDPNNSDRRDTATRAPSASAKRLTAAISFLVSV